MITRSSARNLFPPLDNPDLSIRRRSRVDPTLLNDFKMATEGNGDPPVPDLRTMEELCQPTLNGRGGPIASIAIQATNFGLKNDMIQQVQNSCQFHGVPGDDANKHLDKFLHVTQCIKVNGFTDDAFRLYLFPYSLTHHATAWFDRFPRNSINTFEQMAKRFLGKYFPPFMVMKLRNEITNFRQRPDESLFEAWKRYKLSINRCPNHNMLPPPLAKHKTYMLREPIKVLILTNPKGNNQGRNQFFQGASHGPNPPPTYQAPAYQASGYQAPVHQPPIPQPQVVTTTEFTNYMKENDAILKNMKTNMASLKNSNLELKNLFGQFMKMNTASSSGSGTLPSNTVTNLKEDLKGISTRSGNAYQRPTIPTTSYSHPQVVKRETEVTKDTVPPTNNESTKDVQPSIVQTETPIPNSEPVVAPFSRTIKSLLTNKDKLYELARTPLNEHCSAVLLKKLPEKLGDPGKFLILCDFSGMDECLALADLGASINLMLLSVWNNLSLPELTPALMTVELADRSISRPIAGELTLRVNNEAVTFNLDRTWRYSANYNDMTANRIDVIDMACEEYSQEVLSFSDMIVSGNPTPYYDPIVSTSSPTLTPFRDSDFLLEEVDAFLALEDDPTSPEVDHSYYDTKGDILLLEAFLNEDPSLLPPNQGMYLPQIRKELKIYEAKNDKSLIDEPPEVELKDLPPHLEYAFLEGDDKLPVIIANDLSVEEKASLIKVLKSHKQAIAWKLSDIKGINLEFYTHKILIEDDFEPMVQHQRRVIYVKSFGLC
nr:reverse transcriptase domain-containing protein [Tanacetum cinerariifolium]